jgi:hypothetical protein
VFGVKMNRALVDALDAKYAVVPAATTIARIVQMIQ